MCSLYLDFGVTAGQLQKAALHLLAVSHPALRMALGSPCAVCSLTAGQSGQEYGGVLDTCIVDTTAV